MSAFGSRLRELRERAGLSQVELAQRAGLHRFGVAKLEQGLREPTWATVQALARALGVDCRAFQSDDPEEGAEPGTPVQKSRPRGRPRKTPPAGPAAIPDSVRREAEAPPQEQPERKRKPSGKPKGKDRT